MEGKAINCFISYSHKDKDMYEKFKVHLKNTARRYSISEWYDGMISPGEEIDKAISSNINKADIIFLLISPNYIASYYCFEKELNVAIKRHEKNECVVVPVIIKKFDAGKYPFSKLKYVPTDGRPISSFRPHDDGFVDAFKGINSLLDKFVLNRKQQPIKSNVKKESKNKLASLPETAKEIEYTIVKNGKVTEKNLSQKEFNNITSFSYALSQFIYDANILFENQLSNLTGLFTSRSQEKTVLKKGKQDIENLLVQLFAYIQTNLVGKENTCMHFRVEDNNFYNSFVEVGYPTIQLQTEPILKTNSMIECSISTQMPVIKSLNNSLHKIAHPNETINRNYITFAFNEISKRYDINISLCISIVGKNKANYLDDFLPMSILRFDKIIENYLIQYIEACSKINKRYNIKKVLNYRGV